LSISFQFSFATLNIALFHFICQGKNSISRLFLLPTMSQKRQKKKSDNLQENSLTFGSLAGAISGAEK
jgi:hypothetical protein